MTLDGVSPTASRLEETVNINALPDNPYLLLTPGPLSTTKSVKAAMLRDWCTWDKDYNAIVQDLRGKLVRLATRADGYTAVLMQGSGTFCVEAAIGTAVPAGPGFRRPRPSRCDGSGGPASHPPREARQSWRLREGIALP